MLAANAPDIDGVSAAGGSLVYLKYHRNLTHSLLMAPFMALLPLAVVRLVTRKPVDWRWGYLASLLGLASHLALDLTNVYGVRLLLPFSARWLRLDLTSVVDPWIWGALLLAVIGPALGRLVDSEIGAKARPGRIAAILALAFLLAYNGARAAIHGRALAILNSRIYEGGSPRQVAAFPDAFSPFAWRGVTQGASFYALFDWDVRREFDPAAGTLFYQPDESEAMRLASQTEPFRVFLDFAQFPAWTVTPVFEPPGGLRVQLTDLRFGTPRRPGFTAVALLDGRSQVTRSWFSFSRPVLR
jgi:inner membrane protein